MSEERPMRVLQLAQELDITSKELLALARDWRIPVKSAASVLPAAAVQELRVALETQQVAQRKASGPPPGGRSPVRITVDLQRDQHQQLNMWCAQTAGRTGQSRITTASVMRALLAELLADDMLADRVKKRILQ